MIKIIMELMELQPWPAWATLMKANDPEKLFCLLFVIYLSIYLATIFCCVVRVGKNDSKDVIFSYLQLRHM